MAAFLRVVIASRQPFPFNLWIARNNALFRIQSRQRWLYLSSCLLVPTHEYYHRETMHESNADLPLAYPTPHTVIEPLAEDAPRHNGPESIILKSGKLRSLFQWSRRTTRALPHCPRPPAPDKGGPGKGKPEDESRATPSNSRHDTSSLSPSSNSSSSTRGSHSSGRSRRCDDDDHGVDWDW